MIKAGVKELKNGLSKFLAKVKDGQVIIITEHGKTIARIIKEPGSGNVALQKLIGLAVTGSIRLPKKLSDNKPFKPVKVGGACASAAIIEDRR